MRSWLPLILLQPISSQLSFASPHNIGHDDAQVVINAPSIYSGRVASNPVKTWTQDGLNYIKQDNLIYELVTHPGFEEHRLRVTQPDLCDTSVKQYSGYLDISSDRHIFFWFFESRTAPADAPLILWFNGGPGCSASFGLLYELGPCTVVKDGNETAHNPHSWNANANVIFLDQPINTGYSYSDRGDKVSTTPESARDVYSFLQLFLNRYPEYSKTAFHIAAESYGGIHAPNIASVIFHENQHLRTAPISAGLTHINLASIVLGNGLTNPYHQFGSTAEYLCNGPYPILKPDHPECTSLRRTKIPICQRLIQSCYAFKSRLTCAPAQSSCYGQVWGAFDKTGRNLYDVRLPCDRKKDGPTCYKEPFDWVDKWMNDAAHKEALGVNPALNFTSCNADVVLSFIQQGDGMYPTHRLLQELVDSGIRLLVYAGNADMVCNYMGEERWVNELNSKFKEEFQSTISQPWIMGKTGEVVGEVRSAGGNGLRAGNITFVTVYEAGHMVPFDQPAAASELITRWIANLPLFVQSRST